MLYLTFEQRQSLQAALETRAENLREEVAKAFRQTAGSASLDVAALQRCLNELREVEQGLAHSRTPDYGICTPCGLEIPYSHLSVNPAAIRCVVCQARFEHRWPRFAEAAIYDPTATPP